jgi:CubicO group peptidase (beta-lactamase class C family)
MIKQILFSVLLVTAFFGCAQNNVSKTKSEVIQSTIEQFENQLLADLEDDRINGSISAAIVKDDKIIWSKTFGFTDRDTKAVADSTTIYRVGSITKSFTVFLMMQLSEEGIIKLDDPVEKYLPEIKNLQGYTEETKITFQQLASHTAGLQREPDWEDAFSGPSSEWEEKVLQSIAKTSFQSKPGEAYNYSNIGYGILGLALSKAAKKSYTDLVEEKIFQPLHMQHTYFVLPKEKVHTLAKGMEGGPFGELNLKTPEEEHEGRGYKVPNGAIYSTPNDLAKFMMCVMGSKQLIKESNLALMQNPVKAEDDWWQSYGLGMRLLRDSIISTAGHTGAVSGYTANFMFDRESGFGVVTMRNYNWGMTNLDLRAFAILRRLKIAAESVD